MICIFVEDTFDSAHFLPNVPKGHKCRNLHGHTYHIRIEIGGEVMQEMGWVVDYAVIKTQWERVKVKIDHRNLNEIPGLSNSTCENLASWIWAKLARSTPGLSKLEIRETENCGVVITSK